MADFFQWQFDNIDDIQNTLDLDFTAFDRKTGTISFKWETRRSNNGYFFHYDRAILNLTLPESVQVLDSDGGFFQHDPGQKKNRVSWIVNGMDKKIHPSSNSSPWQHHTIQISVDDTNEVNPYSLEVALSLQIGPFQGEPGTSYNELKNCPAIYNYQKWYENPEQMYWYQIASKKSSTTRAPFVSKFSLLRSLAAKRKSEYERLKSLFCQETWQDTFWKDFGPDFIKYFADRQVDHLAGLDILRYTEKDGENGYANVIRRKVHKSQLTSFVRAFMGYEFAYGYQDNIPEIVAPNLNLLSGNPAFPDLDSAVAMVTSGYYLSDYLKYLTYLDTNDLFGLLDPKLLKEFLPSCSINICSGGIVSLCQECLDYLFGQVGTSRYNSFFDQMAALIDQEISIYDRIIDSNDQISKETSCLLVKIYKQQYDKLFSNGKGLLSPYQSNIPFYQYFWNAVADSIPPQAPNLLETKRQLKAIGHRGTMFLRFDRALANELQYRFNPCPEKGDDITVDGLIDVSELNRIIRRWQINNQDVTMVELIKSIGQWKNMTRYPLSDPFVQGSCCTQ